MTEFIPATSATSTSTTVRVLARLLVACTVVLLILGGLTTSRRAGMDDPAWPTEPWYLVVNHQVFQEQRTGFLLEHTHRFAGWTTGLVAAALAFAAWFSGTNYQTRFVAILSLVLLLLCYGWFHGQMMTADKQRSATGSFTWPGTAIAATGLSVLAVLFLTVLHLVSKQPGRVVRAVVTAILMAVMLQGLLGGLRVFLDKTTGLKSTLGVELSQLHGAFAQVVFATMLIVPVLTARRREGDTLSPYDRLRFGWLTQVLVLAVFVQLIWAVWVRHAPTPLTQRLHILTAFVVAALLVALAIRTWASSDARRVLGWRVWLLLGILGVQITLGVEAWMGKFSATGPEAAIPPMDRDINTYTVLLRTAHQILGAMLFGFSAVIAFLSVRKPARLTVPQPHIVRKPDVDAVPVAVS